MKATTPTAPATLTGELKEIALAAIVASKTNPRRNFGAEALSELADSIKAQGITVPLIVRPLLRTTAKNGSEDAISKALGIGEQRFELVDGERRFRAAQSVRLDSAPCVVKTLTDEQVQKVQLLSFLREDITDLEAAEGYQRLIDSKAYTAETLATELGIGRATIFDRLKLVKLTKAPKAALQSGAIPAATAALIAGVPSDLQEKLTKEILAGDYRSKPLSYRAAKEHIENQYRVNLNKAQWKLDDATLDAKAGACSACPKKATGICLDPTCFAGKMDATWHQLQRDAEKNGTEIIPESVYAKAHYGIYVAADDECYEDNSSRKYRALAKHVDLKPAATRDKHGAIIEVFRKESLMAALRKAKVIKASSSGSTDYERKQREESKKNKARRALLRLVFAAATPRVAVPEKDVTSLKFWQLMAQIAVNEFHDFDAAEGLCAALGVEVKGSSYDRFPKALAAHAAGIKDVFSALQFTLKLWTFNQWLSNHTASFGANFTAIAAYCGIDLAKLEADAAKELTEKKKPAKAKSPAPTPKEAKPEERINRGVSVGRLAPGVLKKTKPTAKAKTVKTKAKK